MARGASWAAGTFIPLG